MGLDILDMMLHPPGLVYFAPPSTFPPDGLSVTTIAVMLAIFSGLHVCTSRHLLFGACRCNVSIDSPAASFFPLNTCNLIRACVRSDSEYAGVGQLNVIQRMPSRRFGETSHSASCVVCHRSSTIGVLKSLVPRPTGISLRMRIPCAERGLFRPSSGRGTSTASLQLTKQQWYS
ncbi:hypothetical protein PUNSTDRAFT_120752 [Punctularia strigosozonata HHB-11173 SS5]|uniref:uncharacterized protein n=1 Tax=Punctularia strigosozonata (strain HHB-11173) TaxID=741275 RepID=UPI0004417F2C|nr:uncharacterized protein PUNSTDRAFT_120752 [Punctularia strigosozonata HHB-11173 SS5]EIN08364.1 hypothetical protein PUNSTDRAFT_120752 [Punctularia strigosozonata HHB-11173 SS5]